MSLLYYDSETTGLSPHHDRVVLAQFMWEGGKDVTLLQDPDPAELCQLIDSATAVVGHNLGFDLGMLHHVPTCRIYDTLYLARLAEPKHLEYTLDACASRAGVGHLFEGVNKKAMQRLKWDQVDLDGPAGEYARADVLALPAIFNQVKSALEHPLYPFDEASIRAGLRIQEHGLPIMHPEAAAYRNRLVRTHRELLEDLPFNPNSTKQTCAYLRIESSGDAVLARLIQDGNETAGQVRLARRLGKSINFLDKMLAYPRYMGTLQPAARSGRFTSNNNNVQNLPREFKQFIGSRKNVVISADFSQLELRTVACISQDQVMIDLFIGGQDLHDFVAERLFGAGWTKQHRQIAKTFNFAMLYGASPEKVQLILLARAGVDLEIGQVQTLYNTWLQTFPGVAAWQRRGRRAHYRKQPGQTPAGRPYVSKRHTDYLNIQNQGAGAEVARSALHYIQNRVKPPAVLFNFMHDAYAVEAPNAPEVYEPAARAIYDGMAQAWKGAPFKTFGIPMPIDVGVAHNLADADALENCLFIYRGADQMKQHKVEQNSDAWMELRGKFRTASQAAIVCGASPFTSPTEFKLIQAGLKKQFYSKAMQLGHELEDKVRAWASWRTFEPQTWSHGKYLASLDGIAGDELIEIKVSSHTYNSLADGEVPDHYWLQVQQQLHCSPAKTGYLVAYCPKTDRYARSEPIAEDPAAMKRIEEAWEVFDAMPIPEGPVDRTDDGTVVPLFEEYAQLKHEVEAAKNRMDVIRAQLVDESQGHGMVANGYKLTKRQGAARVDYKKACLDAKVDTDPYKSHGQPTWAVTLPKAPFEPA